MRMVSYTTQAQVTSMNPTKLISIPSPLPLFLPSQLNEADDNDVSVSFSDQQSINAFSRFNNKVSQVEEDLKKKQEEKEAIEEVALEMELVDEEEEVL